MIARLGLALFATASLLCAQIPDHDIRNTETPNTDTHFTFKAPSTLAEWQERRNALRTQILAAAGLLPMPEKNDLRPQVFGRVERNGYTVEKTLLETLPGYFLGGNLYRPTATGKHPAVLVAHGHWQYGRLENQQLCSTQALSATLARLGFVVFMYDMAGYNDTIQTPHRFGGDAERLWSFGPLGLQLWNSTRVVDFLSSLPEVDADKIAMAGPSGGATQTLMLTAVDDRIHFSAPVNMISGYMQGGDFCENAPGLRLGTSNIEIAAMAAPRPMLVVAATGDWTKHVPKEEFPEIQPIYKLYEKPDNVSVVQMDAPHNLNQGSREAVERFFDKWVLSDAKSNEVAEKDVHIEELQDMLALHNRKLPPDALSYKQIFELWRQVSAKQTDAIADMDLLRRNLATILTVKWPEHVVGEKTRVRDHILLGRTGEGDRISGVFRRRGRTAVLIVDPDGADAAQRSSQLKRALSRGQSLLTIDTFQTGPAVAPRDRSHQHFLTFNRSDDANRVQDILTALRYLSDQHFTAIELYGTGKAAWWVEFAAAVAPPDLKLTLHIPAQALVDTEEAFLANFNVPGVLRAGGLRTADRLLQASKRVQ